MGQFVTIGKDVKNEDVKVHTKLTESGEHEQMRH